MRDHAVLGVVIVPGAALVELALAAGRGAGCPGGPGLVLPAPLGLDDDAARQVQITVAEADSDGRRAVAVYSRLEGGGQDGPGRVTCHARGVLVVEAEQPAVPFPAAWPPPGAEPGGPGGAYPAG